MYLILYLKLKKKGEFLLSKIYMHVSLNLHKDKTNIDMELKTMSDIDSLWGLFSPIIQYPVLPLIFFEKYVP